MTDTAFLLLGLTAIIGALAGILAFAILRLGAAARDASRRFREGGAETAFLTAALQEALQQLRAQERASQARAEQSERLSDEIIASLASGLLMVGVAGDIKILNPAGRRLLGLEKTLEAGSDRPASFRELLGTRAAPLVEVIDECLTSRQPIVRRAVETRPTGTRGPGASHLGVTVSPIFDESGTLQGAICLFTDLTAVVDLEEQLRLRDSLARLGELTAGLAHEFRNGLATIHGYARLLDPAGLPATFRPYVLGLRTETEALGKVVENFLTFARPTPLMLTNVDIGSLAARVAEEIRADLAANGGSLRIEGEFGTVQGDEILLRQALRNLLRNAVEACVEAGVAPDIVVGGIVDQSQRVLRVTVADNGPGIKTADRDRVFRPFFTTRAHGTGLGLALVQKIIVTHNGWVQVADSDRGARLELTLPLVT